MNTKIKIIISMMILSLSAKAAQSINYSGTIHDSVSGEPIVSSGMVFNVKVKTADNCILLEENHSKSLAAEAGGFFSLNIGEGSNVFGSLDNAFKVTASPSCKVAGSFGPVEIGSQKLVDITISGGSPAVNISLSNLELKSAGSSMVAKTLNGKSEEEFAKIPGSNSGERLSNQSILDALIAGTSSLYSKAAEVSSAISTALSNYYTKSEVDSSLDQKITKPGSLVNNGYLKWNGSSWETKALETSDISGLDSALSNKLDSSSLLKYGTVSTVDMDDVDGLQTALGEKMTAISGLTNQFLRFDGNAWIAADINISDVKSRLVGSPSAFAVACGANQTMTWESLTDAFICQDISGLDASKISSGLIDSARIDGSTITNLSASNLASGTIPADRIAGYKENISVLDTSGSVCTPVSPINISVPSAYTVNNLFVSACGGGKITNINLPDYSVNNSIYSINIVVSTPDTNSNKINVQYGSTPSTAAVFWDANSTYSSGGSGYSGFDLPTTANKTVIVSCSIIRTTSTSVYCGIAAQY